LSDGNIDHLQVGIAVAKREQDPSRSIGNEARTSIGLFCLLPMRHLANEINASHWAPHLGGPLLHQVLVVR
jgi:hypothetical protein